MSHRYLVIVEGYPWPEITGTSMRNAAFVEGLVEVADIDLCVLQSPASRAADPGVRAQASSVCGEVAEFALPIRDLGITDRIGWIVDRRLPPELFGYDYASLRAAIRERFTSYYDQVWYLGIRTFHAVGPWADTQLVVDVNDLEDHKLASMPASRSLVATAKRSLHVGAWRRLQNQTILESTVSIVCSDDDRSRLSQHRNVSVIANSYPVPIDDLRVRTPEPPVLLFPGSFAYGPNAQGADWLASNVAPLLKRYIPDARIRLAGLSTERTHQLASDQIEVAGFVRSMSDELGRASCVIVPLLSGSGTRLKIIEAFAHHVPVVTTSIGCAGLGAVNGEHVLIADTPEAFAESCRRVVEDRGMATSLVEAAHSHYRRNFSRDVVISQIATLSQTVPSNVSQMEHAR